LTELRSRRSR